MTAPQSSRKAEAAELYAAQRAPERPWVGQFQSEWELRSGDDRLPKWMRVAALAMGKHRANGHAQFAPGDLALTFGEVDQDTGEIFPDRHVGEHINRAVSLGWLANGSGTRCLIVPGHTYRTAPGNPTEPCRWHDRVSMRARRNSPV